MPSRAGGDSGGRSLVFFTHGEGLEPQSGSASKSPQAARCLPQTICEPWREARAKVLTAEERHERARQTAEARWARRKPR
jgi:hypothetical protein